MATIEKRVREALQHRFSESEIRFDHARGERVSGFIVSKKFSRLGSEARYDMIWNLLRAHLNPKEQRQVMGFLAFTPAEEKAFSETNHA
jgi:hypothetical protein